MSDVPVAAVDRTERTGSPLLVCLLALFLVGRRRLLFAAAAGAGRPPHAEPAGAAGARRPRGTVLLRGRLPPVLRTGDPQRYHQADRRYQCRRACWSPRAKRGSSMPTRPTWRCRAPTDVTDLRTVARLFSGTARGLRGGLPAGAGLARRQATDRGDAPFAAADRRQRGGLVSRAGASHQPPGQPARHAVDGRGRDARARAARERVPGTPARDRLPRPCARRLLLGGAGRPHLLHERDARQLARLRPCPGRLGRTRARRHRGGRCRRHAHDGDGRRRRREDRAVRHRPQAPQRPELPGAHPAPGRLRRGPRARAVADAGDQPRPGRRAGRGPARRRGALRPFLQFDPDGHRLARRQR